MLDLLYIMYVYLLPNFYTESDRLLFVEFENEVWDELKVNDTITKEVKK